MKTVSLKSTSLSALLCMGVLSTPVGANPHASGPSNANQMINHCNATTNLPKGGITVPMHEGSRKHRLVDVTVNDSVQRAVVDTGGMGIGGIVSAQVMDNFAQKTGAQRESVTHGAHGQATSRLFNMNRTDIGGAAVDNLMFMRNPGNILKKDNITTLIGSRYLCQFLLSMDFANNQMTLNDRHTPVKSLLSQKSGHPRWFEIPFESFRGTGGILFDIEVNGKTVRAALDTGSPYTALNDRAAALVGVDLKGDKVTHKQTESGGLHGKTIESYAETELNYAVSGGQLNKPLTTRINNLHAFGQIFGDNPGVILGLPFFEGRTLVVDYLNSKLYISA